MQPIQRAIESLHAKDLCPRLHVDVTHADAVCPDFVRERYKEQLVIDLDPSYPLDLAFTEVGVEADLAFQGHVARCVFPWAAIYIVGERGTGRGQVFADNIPASLRHQFAPAGPPEIDPKLTEVRDDVKAKRSSRRRKRRGAASEPEPEPARGLHSVASVEAADEADEADEAASEAEPAEDAASTAETRRSAFRVIDGGE
jgi:stringent starvation protein B